MPKQAFDFKKESVTLRFEADTKRVRTGAADQLSALYHIFRKRAGVYAGVGRAYGVRDF